MEKPEPLLYRKHMIPVLNEIRDQLLQKGIVSADSLKESLDRKGIDYSEVWLGNYFVIFNKYVRINSKELFSEVTVQNQNQLQGLGNLFQRAWDNYEQELSEYERFVERERKKIEMIDLQYQDMKDKVDNLGWDRKQS